MSNRIDAIHSLIYYSTQGFLRDYVKSSGRQQGKLANSILSAYKPVILRHNTLPSIVKIYAWHISAEAVDNLVFIATDLAGDIVGVFFPKALTLDDIKFQIGSKFDQSKSLLLCIASIRSQDDLKSLFLKSKYLLLEKSTYFANKSLVLSEAFVWYLILKTILYGCYKAHRAILDTNNPTPPSTPSSTRTGPSDRMNHPPKFFLPATDDNSLHTKNNHNQRSTDTLDKPTQTTELVDQSTQTTVILDKATQTTELIDQSTQTTVILDKAAQTTELIDQSTQTTVTLDQSADEKAADHPKDPLDSPVHDYTKHPYSSNSTGITSGTMSRSHSLFERRQTTSCISQHAR